MSDERKGLPSASSWRRFELCKGSYQLELEAKRLGQAVDRPTRWSADGSKIHASMVPGSTVELTESQAKTAKFLAERSTDQLERIFQGQAYHVLREKRLWLNGTPALSGQFDLCAYNDKLALVQDFKTGFSEPDPAEQNSQLKVLAVLVAIHLPSTIEEVVVQIISGPYGVTEARYGLSELSTAYGEIVDTWKAINAPDAPFNPSPEACKYCKALLICQAVKNRVVPVAALKVRELPLEPERAGRLLDEIALLREHFGKIEEFYYDRLTDDPSASIAGYALVPNAPRREITDVEGAQKRLSEFLEPGELAQVSTLKIGELEKLFGRKAKLKGEALKATFSQLLNGLIIDKTPRPSLKRVKGKAKAEELAIEE